MANEKIREKLEIKNVGVEDIDQFNQLLRYVFQVTNQDLIRSGYVEGEITLVKRPILQNADVIGWFNGDQLVSQLCIYPCNVNVHNKIYAMGGVTGIGTYPEYSGLGLMNDLIKVGLERMREREQWISYLYPYSVPYYRKKGWEIMSDRMTFEIKDSQIPHYPETSGFVERLSIDDKDVKDIYDRFARSNHGAMIRGEMEWTEYWRWENEEERIAAVYYNKNNRPMGYVMYWIARDVFHIKEMIYLDQEARKGLWNFISAHYSMVEKVEGNTFRNEPIAFVLEDSQIQETIEPYFMARIVDVAAFLQHYPYEKSREPFHFVVTDKISDWNNGIFGLTWLSDNQVKISRQAVGSAVHLDINTLSSMLMNYRRPSYFYKIERLVTDQRTLDILEDIIPDKQPYFSDYF